MRWTKGREGKRKVEENRGKWRVSDVADDDLLRSNSTMSVTKVYFSHRKKKKNEMRHAGPVVSLRLSRRK